MVKVYMIQVLKDVDCGFTISICFRLKTNKDLRNCLVNNFFQSSRISLAGTVYYIWSVVNGRPAEIGGRGQISPGLSFRKLQWSFTSFSYSFISLLFYFLLPIFFLLKRRTTKLPFTGQALFVHSMMRRCLCGCSVYDLHIERGIHRVLPVEERLCTMCPTNV